MRISLEAILVVLALTWIGIYSHWSNEWRDTTTLVPVVKIVSENRNTGVCKYLLKGTNTDVKEAGQCGLFTGDGFPVKRDWVPVIGFMSSWAPISEGGWIGNNLYLCNTLYMGCHFYLIISAWFTWLVNRRVRQAGF